MVTTSPYSIRSVVRTEGAHPKVHAPSGHLWGMERLLLWNPAPWRIAAHGHSGGVIVSHRASAIPTETRFTAAAAPADAAAPLRRALPTRRVPRAARRSKARAKTAPDPTCPPDALPKQPAARARACQHAGQNLKVRRLRRGATLAKGEAAGRRARLLAALEDEALLRRLRG